MLVSHNRCQWVQWVQLGRRSWRGNPWHSTEWMSLAQKLLLLTTQWADIPSPPGSGCPRKKCTALVSLVSLDLCSQCGGTNPCLAQKWISERWCLVLCMCNRSLVLSLRQHSATSLEQSLTLKKKKKKGNFPCLFKLITSWWLLLPQLLLSLCLTQHILAAPASPSTPCTTLYICLGVLAKLEVGINCCSFSWCIFPGKAVECTRAFSCKMFLLLLP